MQQKLSILIVEDEILIRMFLDELFKDAGWNVTVAANGDDAAQLLNGFDAVVTDIEMPGDLDGVALAWAVYARSTDVPIIIMSGRMLPKKSSLPPTAHFFAKPVPSDILLQTVTELATSRLSKL